MTTTNYPGTPTQPASQGNEVDEAYPGRVYYVSTDQNGNFRVGEYFRIDQATGRATLNASAFDLAGLTSLRLGSIGAQLGETINEFSSDGTLSGNSNVAVPTEQATKTYVDGKVPAQSGNTGKFLTTNGTTTSWETLSVTPQYSIKTANYTAVAGDNLFCDTSAGAFAITLPASPTLNTSVSFVDLAGKFNNYPVTVLRNGQKIMGIAQDLTLNVVNSSSRLVYSNSTYGWRLV